MEDTTKTVDIQPATQSKINWVAGVAGILALGVHFGLPLTPEQQSDLLVVITTIVFPMIMYMRTYMTKTVTPSVAAKL